MTSRQAVLSGNTSLSAAFAISDSLNLGTMIYVIFSFQLRRKIRVSTRQHVMDNLHKARHQSSRNNLPISVLASLGLTYFTSYKLVSRLFELREN